jgi:hypothetical protein
VSGWWLVWGGVFGSFGLGFFVYGKKQERTIPMLCGLGLMVLPYLISNLLVLVVGGFTLIALPWFFRD